MSYFFWGTLVLLVSTLIFYLVFFGLIFYWHEKKTTLVIVPLLYTFEYFITAFLIISTVTLLLDYLPQALPFIQMVGGTRF